MVGGPSPGRATKATLARWESHRAKNPPRSVPSAAERCRALLDDWDVNPYPTQAVQVDPALLRALLDQLAVAETIAELDLRSAADAAITDIIGP